jgi:hypothetical protein
METIELKTTEPIPSVVLQCVDGSEVRIVRARRVHHSRSKTQPWENTEVFYVTANNEELELDDVSDILNFGYLRNEVADKLFVVLDDPDQMWPITASQILKLVAASPIEEAVEKSEIKEEIAEAA